MTFIEKLEKQKACAEALEWAKGYKTKQSAWDNCHRADWMLYAWGKNVVIDSKSHKQLVLVCCACARTVLKYIKDKEMRKITEKSLATTEGWVGGDKSIEEVRTAAYTTDAANIAASVANVANVANTAAYAAAAYVAAYTTDAANIAASVANVAARVAAAYAAANAAYVANVAAYRAANAAVASTATYDSALKKMADIIRTIQPKCPNFLKKP